MDLKALFALRAMRAESDGYLIVVKKKDGSWVAVRGDVDLVDLFRGPEASQPIYIADVEPPSTKPIEEEPEPKPASKSPTHK